MEISEGTCKPVFSNGCSPLPDAGGVPSPGSGGFPFPGSVGVPFTGSGGAPSPGSGGSGFGGGRYGGPRISESDEEIVIVAKRIDISIYLLKEALRVPELFADKLATAIQETAIFMTVERRMPSAILSDLQQFGFSDCRMMPERSGELRVTFKFDRNRIFYISYDPQKITPEDALAGLGILKDFFRACGGGDLSVREVGKSYSPSPWPKGSAL